MQPNPVFNKSTTKAIANVPSPPKEESCADECNQRVEDNDLCREMLMMSKFATCYPNFFPDQSLFR